MEEPFWEAGACFMCKYWWIFLLVVVIGLTAYFTRDYWLPLLQASLGG